MFNNTIIIPYPTYLRIPRKRLIKDNKQPNKRGYDCEFADRFGSVFTKKS